MAGTIMIDPARRWFTFLEYCDLHTLDLRIRVAATGLAQTAKLESIACELAVDDLYRDPLAVSA